MNVVVLTGRIGQDVELRQAGDTPVVNLSVATNGIKGETHWHRVTVFGKQAESCAKFLSKGKMVGVTGRIEYGRYEKDGVQIPTTDIIASRVEFLSPKSETTATSDVHPGVPNHAPNFDASEEIPY